MFLWRAVVITGLVLTHIPALAADNENIQPRLFLVSGDALLKRCSSSDQDDKAFCMGYVAGVSDGLSTAVGIEPQLDKVIPKLDMIADGQDVVARVVGILRLVRDGKVTGMTLDEPASSAVFIAIRQQVRISENNR
jgi:hypothetical protein